MPCAVLFLKGDWVEFSGSLGSPSHNDGLRPCFGCVAYGANMYLYEENTSDQLVWRENQEGDYERACQRCEFPVVVPDAATRDLLNARLKFDKRRDGSHGLSLTRDVEVNGVRLQTGDRLEPSPSLPDVGLFDEAITPITVIFWRVVLESVCRHRNPIFQVTGMSPVKSLTIDELHCSYLGTFNRWCAVAI